MSQKHVGNSHLLGDSSHLPLPVSLWCFTTANFLLKIHVLLQALAVVVAALSDLKIQLSTIP